MLQARHPWTGALLLHGKHFKVPPKKTLDPLEPPDPLVPLAPFDHLDPLDSLDPLDPLDPRDPIEPFDPLYPLDPLDPMQHPMPLMPSPCLCQHFGSIESNVQALTASLAQSFVEVALGLAGEMLPAQPRALLTAVSLMQSAGYTSTLVPVASFLLVLGAAHPVSIGIALHSAAFCTIFVCPGSGH